MTFISKPNHPKVYKLILGIFLEPSIYKEGHCCTPNIANTMAYGIVIKSSASHICLGLGQHKDQSCP